VPSYVLRKLLRGQDGAQWLEAIMDGCGDNWWLDMCDSVAVGRDTIAKVKQRLAQRK
jgi:hypothetical protein